MVDKSLLLRCETLQFLQLSLEQLSNLLAKESRHRNNDSEEEVFDSVIKWLDHNKLKKEQYLPQLLPKINIRRLSYEFILENLHAIALCPGALNLAADVRREWKEHTTTSSSKLLAIGYQEDSNSVVVEEYCSEQKQWKVLTQFRSFWVDFNAICYNNVIYIFGGWHNGRLSDRSVCLALDTLKRTRLKPIKPIAWPAVAVMADHVYMIGGETQHYEEVAEIQCINLSRPADTRVKKLHYKLYGASAVALDGRLYVIGGCCFLIQVLSCVNFYDFKNDEWNHCSRMSVERDSLGAVAHEGHIYAVGGRDNDQHVLNTVERYSPKCDTWVKLADLKKPRRGVSCVSFEKRLLAVGGFRERTVEVYNADTNDWALHSELNGTYRSVVALIAENSKVSPQSIKWFPPEHFLYGHNME